jgi:hypothetical protein
MTRRFERTARRAGAAKKKKKIVQKKMAMGRRQNATFVRPKSR